MRMDDIVEETGLRQTVIEVVSHEKEPDTYFVVSGWGAKSDWYQNIEKNPQVAISTLRRRRSSQCR